MKKLRGFFLLVAVALITSLTFVACGDDDEPDNPKNSIVGSWSITSVVSVEKENGEIIDESTEEIIPGYIVYKFDKNGTLHLFERGIEIIESAKWTKQGDKITVTYVDEEDGTSETNTLYITTLSKNKLVVEMNETYTENGVKYEDLFKITMVRYDK